MAAIQKGTVGALRGIPGTTGTSTYLTVKTKKQVALTVHNVWEIISSYEYGNDNKSDEIPGNDGGPVLIAGYDYRKKLKVECIAAVGTASNQDSAIELFMNLPAYMDTVDIASGGGDSEIVGTGETEWLVQSATRRGVRDGFATASFDLFRTASHLEPVTS